MRSKLTLIICCLVILASGLFLWFWFRPKIGTVDREAVVGINTGLGTVLAEQVIKAVNDRGRIVLVNEIFPGQRELRPDLTRKVFDAELSKHPAITVIDSVGITGDRVGVSVLWPTGAFADLLSTHPNADAIVFFIDLPEWAAVAGTLPKAGIPKLIALDRAGPLTQIHYGGYFSREILTVLIGAPTRPVKKAERPQTPHEWFNQRFQIYTPADFSSIPEGGTAGAPAPPPPP